MENCTLKVNASDLHRIDTLSWKFDVGKKLLGVLVFVPVKRIVLFQGHGVTYHICSNRGVCALAATPRHRFVGSIAQWYEGLRHRSQSDRWRTPKKAHPMSDGVHRKWLTPRAMIHNISDTTRLWLIAALAIH